MARSSAQVCRRSSQLAVVAVGRDRPQDRAQLVGADDVDQRGERVLPALVCDVADTSTLEACVRLGVRVTDDVVGEVGEAAEHAGLLGLRALDHVRLRLGVLQLGDALGHRKAEDLAPVRDAGTARSG